MPWALLDNGPGNFGRQYLVDLLGEPERELEAGEYSVLVYPWNLSTALDKHGQKF